MFGVGEVAMCEVRYDRFAVRIEEILEDGGYLVSPFTHHAVHRFKHLLWDTTAVVYEKALTKVSDIASLKLV